VLKTRVADDATPGGLTPYIPAWDASLKTQSSQIPRGRGRRAWPLVKRAGRNTGAAAERLQERGFRFLVRSYQGGRVGKTGRELWKNLISSKEKKMKGRKNIFTLSPDFKPCYQLLGQ